MEIVLVKNDMITFYGHVSSYILIKAKNQICWKMMVNFCLYMLRIFSSFNFLLAAYVVPRYYPNFSMIKRNIKNKLVSSFFCNDLELVPRRIMLYGRNSHNNCVFFNIKHVKRMLK